MGWPHLEPGSPGFVPKSPATGPGPGPGATCLGSWESDGSFNAWIPLWEKNKGRGCKLSLQSGSGCSGWEDTYLSALLSRLSRLPHVALGALQADNTKGVNQGREGQAGPPGTLSLASGRWKSKSQG